MKEIAIAIKRGKAQEGYIVDEEFTAYDEHKGEIPSGYLPLHDFLKLTNPKQTVKQSESLRKKIGYTKIYIYVADNEDFWAYTNHKCNVCKCGCKQSSKVQILSCPQYDPID